ncbi:MAG TPA: hypothetical protein VGQ07_06460 [Nitrospirales bacterium]|jgi:hypothetical protein|nr:hypothetical protein [Nitrospirales bacterium]
MRTQLKLRVLIGLVLVVGFGGGASDVSAQSSGSPTASEVENLKKQMAVMEEQLRQLRLQVERLAGQPAAPGSAGQPAASADELATQKRLSEIEGKANAALDATKKTFASQFNPSISLAIDTIASYKSNSQGFNPGDGTGTRDAGQPINNSRPAGADFNLRTAELFISADVDPFTRAYATINASADAANGDEAALTVEEAAIVTTRLPYNLTVRGGRFFADFGTLIHRHDHDLPFVDRPPSIDTLVGGEGQTNGVEVSWLAPTPFYLRASATVGNKFGSDFRDGVSNTNSRPIKGLTYLGRLQTYFDINDDNNVELGGSIAEAPNAEDVTNSGRFERRLVGLDFKYRWYPLGRGLRQSLTVAGEILHDVGDADPVNGGPRIDIFGNPVRQGAWGGYVYAEYRLSKQWRPGFRFDYFQQQSEPLLVTNPFTGLPASTQNATGHRTDNRTWSPYLTWFPSEFQRLRLQYNRSDRGNAQDANEFFLQWTVFLGSHVHGFSERE